MQDKVTSLLSLLDLDTSLDGLLPNGNALCVIRYQFEEANPSAGGNDEAIFDLNQPQPSKHKERPNQSALGDTARNRTPLPQQAQPAMAQTTSPSPGAPAQDLLLKTSSVRLEEGD